MGQLKALLPWQGKPLLVHQLDALLEAGVACVVVVLGHQAELLKPLAEGKPGAAVVLNPHYMQGKTTSIKAGISSLPPDVTDILILAVDQPRSGRCLKALVDAHLTSRSPISQPRYQGKRGHPMLFRASLLPELKAIQEETQGLKAVVRRHQSQVNYVDVDWPEVLLDLNSPEDYQKALQSLQRP